MKNRYFDRDILVNDDDQYRKQFLEKERGIKTIRQYDTPIFKYPTVEEISELQVVEIVWQSSSRLYKLASKYYNDPSLWWVIAMFNKKPTEAHFNLGETVYVPLPLEQVLRIMEA